VNERGTHPIKQWRLKDFKSVEDAAVDLSMLTVLVGANSSGKTTLIQSILLFAQACQRSRNDEVLPLNGSLLTLGDFGTALRFRSQSKRMGFGGTFSFSSPILTPTPAGTVLDWNVIIVPDTSLEHPGSATIEEIHIKMPAPPPESEKEHQTRLPMEYLEYKGKRSNDAPRDIAGYRRGLRTRSAYVPFRGTIHTPEDTVETAGLAYKAGFPQGFVSEQSQSRFLASQAVELFPLLLATSRQREFEFDDHRFWSIVARPRRARRRRDSLPVDTPSVDEPLSTSLRQWLTGLQHYLPRSIDTLAWRRAQNDLRNALSRLDPADQERLAKATDDRYAEHFVHAIASEMEQDQRVWVPVEQDADSLGTLCMAAADILSRVHYLGPLRQEPQVMYRLSQAEQFEAVGTRGEHTAAVLHAFARKRVSCPTADGRTKSMSLGDAVDYWLTEFGLATAVSTRDKGRLGLELSIKPTGMRKKLDLTNVGVGVSQVLPVLVMTLLADTGSVILMEQPELHLHPAMQQKLGDFLLECARSGRQLIVETHSDHLVSRLRRRIAEDLSDATRSMVGLIFAENPKGTTTYRRVDVTPLGSLEDWPTGFFDQTAIESQEILRAGLKKKLRGNSLRRRANTEER